MPPLRGSICIGVDEIHHPFAPGLPTWRLWRNPYSGRAWVKSLRSSYTGLYPQTLALQLPPASLSCVPSCSPPCVPSCSPPCGRDPMLTPISIKNNSFLNLIILEQQPLLSCFGLVTRQKRLVSRRINLREALFLIDVGVKMGPASAIPSLQGYLAHKKHPPP
jgi:hypothetical protein